MRSCWTVWHKAYPQIPPGNLNFYIEEQGPVQGWCQEIRLFAAAAKAAGPNLNRRTFVEAMSKITNFPGGYSPILSYGPDKFSGPTEYRVVKLAHQLSTRRACARRPKAISRRRPCAGSSNSSGRNFPRHERRTAEVGGDRGPEAPAGSVVAARRARLGRRMR